MAWSGIICHQKHKDSYCHQPSLCYFLLVLRLLALTCSVTELLSCCRWLQLMPGKQAFNQQCSSLHTFTFIMVIFPWARYRTNHFFINDDQYFLNSALYLKLSIEIRLHGIFLTETDRTYFRCCRLSICSFRAIFRHYAPQYGLALRALSMFSEVHVTNLFYMKWKRQEGHCRTASETQELEQW